MTNFQPSHPSPPPPDLRTLILEVLSFQIDAARKNLANLRIPRSCDVAGATALRAGMHVHLQPELFFQIRGLTRFQCPRETFLLYPNQVCLLPPLVAHAETVRAWRGPFYNLVVMFHAKMISVHSAVASPEKKPVSKEQREFAYAQREIVLQYLADAQRAFHDTPMRTSLAQGAMIAALSHLAEAFSQRQMTAEPEHPKVWRAKQYLSAHLSEPEVTVQLLAKWLNCSADYLSNLFCRETGMRLTHYINEHRVHKACSLLEQTELNISEVAWASGYRDPGYFARQFRRIAGVSPRAYRKLHIRQP